MKKILGLGLLTLGLGILSKYLSNGEVEKYSIEWFRNLTDKEWEIEREKVRINTQDKNWEWLLRAFDKEWERRESIKHPEEWTPPIHGKHGWYLSDDD